MPNWCDNTVTISHTDPARMAELVEAINDRRFCDFARPVPDDLKITAGFLGDEAKQQAREQQEAANLERYGYKNWYDWCVNEWGPTRDIEAHEHVEYDSEGDTEITFGFDSAWSPPLGVYEALFKQGYNVKGFYFEMGMGFAGVWDNGEDDYFELAGYNSETILEAIPEELDETFGISDILAEYEGDAENG
jgi:hypothetical protein